MKILIVEDDPEIARPIRDGLERMGFFAEISRDGERGLRLARSGSFSVIVLDRMLPGLDGLEVCRQLRAARVNTPILMLTARDALTERVEGLDAGADDYLGKPFELRELVARIRALIRRDQVVKSAVIEVADLEIDTRSHTVRRAGVAISLTVREYSLLVALASNEGNILSRDVIFERVWLNEDCSDNNLSVHVRSLRRKVDDGFEPKLIHTVIGLGYTLRTTPP